LCLLFFLIYLFIDLITSIHPSIHPSIHIHLSLQMSILPSNTSTYIILTLYIIFLYWHDYLFVFRPSPLTSNEIDTALSLRTQTSHDELQGDEKERFRSFFHSDDGKPFYMLNLIKYKSGKVRRSLIDINTEIYLYLYLFIGGPSSSNTSCFESTPSLIIIYSFIMIAIHHC
jgi:hypothetical protein